MINLEEMGYSEEEIKTLSYAHYKTGLSFETLVIMNKNVKAGNQEFINSVNQFILNGCGSIKSVENFIKTNSPIKGE